MYTRKTTKILAIILSLTLLVTTVGCSQEELPLDESLALTVDGIPVYMDEMMYHIMLAEMQAQLYNSYLQTANYWETTNESGDTIAQLTKENILNDAVQYEIFYQLALDNDYSLTEEENQDCVDKVDSILKSISPTQLAATGLTEDKLDEIQKKLKLSTKQFNDYKESLGVDETALKSEINPDDYREFEIEYLFVPLNQRNDEGEISPLNEDEKLQAYKEISAYIDLAKTAISLTELLNDSTNKNTSRVTAGAVSFLANTDFFDGEEEIENTSVTLTQGETSDVIETSKGYYIIKLINNASTEKYEEAISDLLSTKLTLAMDELKKSHDIKINNKVWDKVTIGEMTITE